MTNQKKKRIGLNMKPRTSITAPDASAANTTVEASLKEGQKTVEITAQNEPLNDTVDACEGAASDGYLASNFDEEKGEKIVALEPKIWTTEDLSGKLAELLGQSAEEHSYPILVAKRDGVVEELIRMVGDRPDGTFGIVITVPEGLIESIRQQAESDKVTPEEWASERFGEWLLDWWSPAKSR